MEFVLLALLILYLVPYTVAASREHPRVNWILWTNLLLGWTGLGWLVALAWSRSEPGGRVAHRWRWLHPPRPSPRPHPHLRVLPGGLQEDDWTPRQAADSKD